MAKNMPPLGKDFTVVGKLEAWLEEHRNWKSEQNRALSTLGDQVFNEGYGASAYGPYLASANGCRVNDFGGNSFLDTAMAGGSAILGHANQVTNDAIIDQLKRGTLYTAPNFNTHTVADKALEFLPWFDKTVFCSSGSEATMRAIRIARAHTGRKKIAIFSGGWHGAHDQVLIEEDYTGAEEAPLAITKGKGILPVLLDHLVLLPYNHRAAFDLIKHHADDLAMVFIEPAQGSNPREDIGLFLNELRQVTSDEGVLLGFDEIITGFRLDPGGGQEHFAVHADIATYGKSLGGGLPIGMIAGTDQVMSAVRDEPVFMGGTFSANPLSMASALATLQQLRPEIYSSLNRNGNRLNSEINEFCTNNAIPAHMTGVGSMQRLVFAAPPVASRRQRDFVEIPLSSQSDFYAAMLMNGVHIAGNRINFLSSAHDEPEISTLVRAYTDVLSACQEAGIFDRAAL